MLVDKDELTCRDDDTPLTCPDVHQWCCTCMDVWGLYWMVERSPHYTHV